MRVIQPGRGENTSAKPCSNTRSLGLCEIVITMEGGGNCGIWPLQLGESLWAGSTLYPDENCLSLAPLLCRHCWCSCAWSKFSHEKVLLGWPAGKPADNPGSTRTVGAHPLRCKTNKIRPLFAPEFYQYPHAMPLDYNGRAEFIRLIPSTWTSASLTLPLKPDAPPLLCSGANDHTSMPQINLSLSHKWGL